MSRYSCLSLVQTDFIAVFRPLRLVGLFLHINREMLDRREQVLARDIVGACNSSLKFLGLSIGSNKQKQTPKVTWYRCIREDACTGFCMRVEALPGWEGDLVEDRLGSLDRLHHDNFP